MGGAAGHVRRLCYLQGGEAGSARMAVRQMVDIARGASGGAASDDEEAELQLQAAAHRWRHPNLVDSEEQEGAAAEQPPSNMGRSSRTLNASPPVPHKLDKTHEGRLRCPESRRRLLRLLGFDRSSTGTAVSPVPEIIDWREHCYGGHIG